MSSRGARRRQDRSNGCGNDRAHHFDLPDPERQHAAPIAATAERTSEPGAQDEPQQSQPLTKAIREPPGTLPFLKDAGLGSLGRDAADGLPGWCHDVTNKLNEVLHDPDSGRVRLDLLDVARRLEKGLEAIKDVAAKSETT